MDIDSSIEQDSSHSGIHLGERVLESERVADCKHFLADKQVGGGSGADRLESVHFLLGDSFKLKDCHIFR